jgi:hypothetical protein
VLGSVDEQHVLKYDSDSNKVEPLSLLINKLNGTKNWTELTQTLGDIGRELRIILLDINGTEISTDGKYGKGCRDRDSQQEKGRAEHVQRGLRWLCVKELKAATTLEAHGA